MSTIYHILRKRPTYEKLSKQLAKHNIELFATQKGDCIAENENTGDYVHFNLNPHTGKIDSFERFGGNDPEPFVEALQDEGYEIIDEHEAAAQGRLGY